MRIETKQLMHDLLWNGHLDENGHSMINRLSLESGFLETTAFAQRQNKTANYYNVYGVA